MKKINVSVLFAVIGFSFLTGCAHQYKWSEYEVTKRLPAANLLATHSSVAVMNAQPDETVRQIGNIGVHNYNASLNYLTEAVVTQLKSALQHRNVSISDSGQKILSIAVKYPRTRQGAWTVAADMEVEVKTGDGVLLTYAISNSTPTTVPRAFNGAVAKAVLEILEDARVQEYLKR